jgi:glycosyltransferase involved in cell wall biosynthesis
MEIEKRCIHARWDFETLHTNGIERMKPGVSIVVCCHNGEARLAETVKHIALQKVPDFIPWEFVLVDNASTDGSVKVAKETWARHNSTGRFRIVREAKLGLSHARARGFTEANYEAVILCDDDNWLFPDYAAIAFMILWQNENIGALGGLGRVVYEVQPPKWIEHAGIFAADEQWSASGKVLSNRIYGAGCVIRKSAYLKLMSVGFKSLLTDRKGTALSSGGDHELCYALSIIGYDIWYDDRLRFSHFISKERLTWEYFIRYAHESTTCFDVLTSYKMIALDVNSHTFPLVVLARDLFYCVRRYVRISLLKFFTRYDSDRGRTLLFRHIILKNKITAYFSTFESMVANHERILKFKEDCIEAKIIERGKDRPQKLKSIFSLKLFRQPQ